MIINIQIYAEFHSYHLLWPESNTKPRPAGCFLKNSRLLTELPPPPKPLQRFGIGGCLLDIPSVGGSVTSRPSTFFLSLITLSAQRPDAPQPSHLPSCRRSHCRTQRRGWGTTRGPVPSGIKPLFFITAGEAAGVSGQRTSPFPHLFPSRGLLVRAKPRRAGNYWEVRSRVCLLIQHSRFKQIKVFF